MTTVINHCAVAILSEAFLPCDFLSDEHQMTEQSFVTLFCHAELTQTISVLGYDKEVGFCYGADVSEGQAICILVNDVRRDLFAHKLVENGVFFWLGCLCFDLLVCLSGLCCLLKFEVFERSQSDVLLHIREVPLEVDAFRLATVVVFQIESHETSIGWHFCHFILEVVVQVRCHKPTMGEHKMTLVVLESLEVGLGPRADITPGLTTCSLEVRGRETRFF